MSSVTELSRPTRDAEGGRRTAELAVLSTVALLVGFAQVGYVLVRVGAGAETDALFLAAAVPQLLLSIVSVAAVSVTVPLLVRAPAGDRARLRWTFVAAITGLFAAMAAVLLLAAPAIASVLGAGLDGDSPDLVASLLRIQAVGMVLNAAGTVAAAGGQAAGDYRRPALGTLAGALAALVAVVVLVPRHGVVAAAWAEVIRYGVAFAVVLPCLGPVSRPAWRAREVADARSRMRPLVLGGAYYRSDIVVDRLVASLAPAGGLSVLAFVQRLYGAGAQVVQNAVAVPAFSELSGSTGAAFDERWRAALRQGRALAIAGWAAIAVPAIVLRGWIGELGDLDGDDAKGIAVVAVLLGGVLLGGVRGQILSNAHYARGDTRTPALIGTVGFTAGIALKVVAVLVAGIPGLAAAISAQYAATAWASRRILERRARV